MRVITTLRELRSNFYAELDHTIVIRLCSAWSALVTGLVAGCRRFLFVCWPLFFVCLAVWFVVLDPASVPQQEYRASIKSEIELLIIINKLRWLRSWFNTELHHDAVLGRPV